MKSVKLFVFYQALISLVTYSMKMLINIHVQIFIDTHNNLLDVNKVDIFLIFNEIVSNLFCPRYMYFNNFLNTNLLFCNKSIRYSIKRLFRGSFKKLLIFSIGHYGILFEMNKFYTFFSFFFSFSVLGIFSLCPPYEIYC